MREGGGYDVVIVGGGHNGLTCGAYLAKAGQRVLVLEARDVVGGGCATKEVAAPGFRHNFHSNFHGIIQMGPVYRDLELQVPVDRPHMDDPVEIRVEVVPEPGRSDLLRCAPPADHVSSFQHEYTLAGLREICAAGETVVAPADNDDVVAAPLTHPAVPPR